MTDIATTIETNSPDLRGAILAHVLHHVVMVPGPVTYKAVFTTALDAVGKPEEECSAEIMTAALLLVRAGLIVCNTYADGCLTIAAETVLTAAPQITGWIWRDPEVSEDEEQ
jgi:hypothetical protein